MKKILAIALCCVMCLGMIPMASAAGNSWDSMDWDSLIDFSTWATAKDNGIELPELNGPLKITANIADFNLTSEGTMVQYLWEKAMEHYLGCDIELTINRTPWADFRTKELVLLGADDVADINSYSQGDAILQYGEDGVVLNIADYADCIKYYWDYVDGHPNGRKVAINADGSMYRFIDGTNNSEDIMGAQSFTAFAYRFDVLKKLGLQPATTIDEFTALCAALQEKINAGELDAKYVIMNNTKDYAFYRGFVGIWHTWDTLYWNGSEWSFGPIENNFREMLKYLRELYAAGYIDPEFATSDFNQSTEKASTGYALVCPTLWAGSVASWNSSLPADSTIEWGLAYLPTGDYGTAWKWGSKLGGKSLNTIYGIYFDADVEHPEHLVAMIDYQYSDEMNDLINWGVKGVTYTLDENGNKTFSDEIMSDASPATKSSEAGAAASCVCRTGIPFVAQNFYAQIQVASNPEPWWNAEDGYYTGKYWLESNRLGGVESVSPYDRPAVLTLNSDEATAKSQLQTACETYAKEESLKFITGEYDINSDAAWEAYVNGVKSQSDEDFDATIAMLNANSNK